MIRLLLVDDHEIVRRGLRELLEAEGDLEVVAQAGSLDEALLLDIANVDVAVLDVRLPDGSGVDLCRQLRAIRPELGCLMLTSFADNEALNASVLAGARGYVLKNVRGDELITSSGVSPTAKCCSRLNRWSGPANAFAARSPRKFE
jgi:two-component system response regulator DevR